MLAYRPDVSARVRSGDALRDAVGVQVARGGGHHRRQRADALGARMSEFGPHGRGDRRQYRQQVAHQDAGDVVQNLVFGFQEDGIAADVPRHRFEIFAQLRRRFDSERRSRNVARAFLHGRERLQRMERADRRAPRRRARQRLHARRPGAVRQALPVAPAQRFAHRRDGVVGCRDEDEVRGVRHALHVVVDGAPRQPLGEGARRRRRSAGDGDDRIPRAPQRHRQRPAHRARADEAYGGGFVEIYHG